MTKCDDDSSDKVPNRKNSEKVSAFQFSETIMLGSLVTANVQREFDLR